MLHRELTRQLKLKQNVIQHFLPGEQLAELTSRARYCPLSAVLLCGHKCFECQELHSACPVGNAIAVLLLLCNGRWNEEANEWHLERIADGKVRRRPGVMLPFTQSSHFPGDWVL